jgi:hypothetical protein
MSAHTHTASASEARKAAKVETSAPPAAVEEIKASIPAVEMVAIDINGTSVNLPRRFAAGMALTDSQAKILDAAYQRQFTNNQTALAKTRAEKFAAAKNDAERAEYVAKTADQIAALYADYEPNVGGARVSQTERNRLDAAWRFAVELVTKHNANPAAGILPKAKGRTVPLPTSAKKLVDADGKPVMDAETGKQAIQTLAEQRDAYATRFLSLPEYSDGIQRHLDAIMAEKGTTKAKAASAAETASLDEAF